MGMLNQFNRWIGLSCVGLILCSGLLWGCGGTETTPSEDVEGASEVGDDSADNSTGENTEQEGSAEDSGEAEGDTDTSDLDDNQDGSDGSAEDTSSCNDSLVMTFDLSGSRFRVDPKSGLAQTAEEEIGPGRAVLRFDAINGAAQLGSVTLLEYSNTVEFSVSDVDTAMETSAGPEACGAAVGSLSGTSLIWSSVLKDYTSEGTVTCNAGSLICGIIGMEEGVAEERNSVQDLDLGNFVFDANLESFEMDWVQVTDDDDATTFLKLSGLLSTSTSEQPVCEVTPNCP
jgi:hypothetical protein